MELSKDDKLKLISLFCPADTSKCRIGTCPIECGQVTFLPSAVGNTLCATIFAILLLAQTVFGLRYRTWGFLVGMVAGLALEITGYFGRLLLHDNPFEFNNFLM
jgi:hypothetical protein